MGSYCQKEPQHLLTLPKRRTDMPLPNSVLREGEQFTGQTRVQGRLLYASTNQRAGVVVRELRGGRARVTSAGKAFFSKFVAELLPRVPVKWIYPKGKVHINGVAYDRFREVPAPHGPDYLPLQAETFRFEVDAGREQDDPEYFLLGLVPYNGRSTQEEVESASRQNVSNWINKKPTVAELYPHAEQRGLGPFAGLKVIMRQYAGFYVYDSSRPILYDERVSHVERGELDVSMLFNRPLRAERPYVPPDLQHIQGLCGQAFYLPKGNCVVEQLWRCLKWRRRLPTGKTGWAQFLSKDQVEADMTQAFEELGFRSGEYPFDCDRGRGWRFAGVNVDMLLYVAKKRKFAVWIFHQGSCVHIFKPDKGEWRGRCHKPLVALCLHGMHGFFYKDACARALAHHHIKQEKPKWVNSEEILHYGGGVKAPFKGEAFDYGRLMELMSEGEVATLCCQKMAEVEQTLRANGVAYHPNHAQSPEVPSSLIVPMLNKKHVRIITAPPDWPMLQALCKALQEEGVQIEYTGQSLASVAFQAAQHFIRSRRSGKPPADLVAKVKGRQGNKCAHCYSCFQKVAHELDHIKPLADGGVEDFTKPELYQLLCPPCHEAKTVQEAADRAALDGESGLFRGFLSQLGPRLYHLFYERTCGLITGIYKGAPPSTTKGLVSYDVRKCRSNGLEQYVFKYGLPVFCWTDDLEELPHFVDGYDFYLVQGELVCHDALLLYFEVGDVQPSDIRAGVKASAHISVERYKAACDKLRACVARARDLYPEWKDVKGEDIRDAESVAKEAVLSMIGMMIKVDFHKYTCTISECSDDHPGRIDHSSRVDAEGTLWRFSSRTRQRSLHGCARPIGVIALHMERARMRWLQRRCEMAGLNPYAAHVDEVFFHMSEYVNPWTRLTPPHKILYKDGTPVYRFVPYSESRTELTKWLSHPQREKVEYPDVPVRFEWELLRNPSRQELKEAVLRCNGLLLEGAGGVGKSFCLKDLIEQLEQDGMTCIKVAYTHDASQEVGGQDGDTILRFLKDHPWHLRNAASTWIIIDEAPMCPLKLYPLLHNFKLFLGARVICCGDWGQNRPIAEMWGEENYAKAEACHSMWHLCGGLRVELTECRRADQAHFDIYCRFRCLKSWSDWPGGQEAACDFLEATYPWNSQLPDVAITNSHEDREYMATLLNHHHKLRAEERGLATYLVRCKGVPHLGTMKPHGQFYVWAGLQTIGSTRTSHGSPIKNGCRYTVTKANEEAIVVRPEATAGSDRVDEIRLAHFQAAQHLRLACARTAASVQGITLRDQRLLLLDARSPYTDHRRLYVCMSRVTRDDYLHVATKEQQATLFGR